MSLIHTPACPVAPREIPAALRSIWRECRPDAARAEVTRALMLNLVVVVADGRSDQQALLTALVGRLPCRAFVVAVRPDAGRVTAVVRGMARARHRSQHLLLEQIDLTASPATMDSIAGIVRPLLVNDIPTHLYWTTDWPRDPVAFDLLASLADHTIVHSALAERPEELLAALAVRRQRGEAVTDLTWLGLRPWRRAMAEALERAGFDAAAASTALVRHTPAAATPALLLSRWLEQRLAAQVERQVRQPAGTGDGAEGACGPDGVELHNGETRIDAHRCEPCRIEVQVTTREACYLPFAVPGSRGREADLLAAAIDMA